jgi:hypothetical protein
MYASVIVYQGGRRPKRSQTCYTFGVNHGAMRKHPGQYRETGAFCAVSVTLRDVRRSGVIYMPFFSGTTLRLSPVIKTVRRDALRLAGVRTLCFMLD